MEPISATDAKTLLTALSSDYENLAKTRKNLEDECDHLKTHIQNQVQQIQTITKDIEALKQEYETLCQQVKQEQPPPQQQQQNVPQGEDEADAEADLKPLVDINTIKPKINVSLYAEIIDQSVICSTAFSPDSANLAIGSDKILRVYNFDQDQFILEAPIGDQTSQETNHVRSISWTPDSQTLICGAEDDHIYVFSVSNTTPNSNEPIGNFKAGNGDVFQVLFFPQGGKFVSAAGDGDVKIWDLDSAIKSKIEDKNPEPLITFKRKIDGPDGQVVATSISISPDGKTIASGYSDKVVCFWDIEKGEKIFEQECHNDGVYSVLFLPDNKRFVTSSLDKTVKIWIITPKSLELFKTLEGHTEFVLTLALDPTGQYLLSGSKDLSCIITKIDEARMLYRLKNHTNSVITVAFNPNGKMFCTGSGDKYVKIWNFSEEDE